MTLDDDLLQVHLHAKSISPEGVQALVAMMQRERGNVKALVHDVYEACIANDDLTNASMLRRTVDVIKLQTGEMQHRLDLISINWRDLVHG